MSVAKITAIIIGGGGALTGVSVGGYKYFSSQTNCSGNDCDEKGSSKSKEEGLKAPKDLSSEKDRPEVSDQKTSPSKKIEPSVENNSKQWNDGSHINAQLMKLKNEKVSLLKDIEDKISDYKDLIRRIVDISKLESELSKCSSKDEVSTGITESDKEELKAKFNRVKEDISKYESMKTRLETGEVSQSESYADKNNTSEERYKDFQSKLDNAKEQYSSLTQENSNISFHVTFKEVRSKLAISESTCSIKDLIKMNDELGRRNLAS